MQQKRSIGKCGQQHSIALHAACAALLLLTWVKGISGTLTNTRCCSIRIQSMSCTDAFVLLCYFFCFSLSCIFFFAHSACLSRPFGIVLCFFAPLHPEFMYPTSANWIGTTLVGVCVWMPPYLHCAHVLCHKEQSVILCALTLSRLAYQQHKQHVRIYDKIVVDGENEAKGTRRREATNS